MRRRGARRLKPAWRNAVRLFAGDASHALTRKP